jgi:hypothetical protein
MARWGSANTRAAGTMCADLSRDLTDGDLLSCNAAWSAPMIRRLAQRFEECRSLSLQTLGDEQFLTDGECPIQAGDPAQDSDRVPVASDSVE